MDIDFSFIYWGKEMGGGGVNTKTTFVWGKKEKRGHSSMRTEKIVGWEDVPDLAN